MCTCILKLWRCPKSKFSLFNFWWTKFFFVLLWIFASCYIYHSKIAIRYIPSQLGNFSIITSLFLDLLCSLMSSNFCKNSILPSHRKVYQNFTEIYRIITFSKRRLKINYYSIWPLCRFSGKHISRAFKPVLFALLCTICSTLYENEEFIINLL